MSKPLRANLDERSARVHPLIDGRMAVRMPNTSLFLICHPSLRAAQRVCGSSEEGCWGESSVSKESKRAKERRRPSGWWRRRETP